MNKRVAVFVGSLRKASLTRKAANALIAAAPAGLDCEIVEFADLPVYNDDLEAKAPAAWTRVRKAVQAADAILFVTPEYNRSIPGGLKNLIDVASRPEGKNLWDGKPAGVVSVTPYKLGAFGANHALRQTFVFLNMFPMQQPEAYIRNAADLFDKKGKLQNADTKKFFEKFITAFSDWIARVGANADGGFDDFIHERDEIATFYVNGDAKPLDAIVAARDPASFYPPMGGVVRGAKTVSTRYDKDAKSFGKGGTSKLDVLHAQASGDLAYWTGLQHAKAKLGGKTVPMTLRITEIFRREDGGWKLIHRHADTLTDAQEKQKK
jgi:NAD(P)H-dependent FMN reductase/ketosteroid isomerase-like protein